MNEFICVPPDDFDIVDEIESDGNNDTDVTPLDENELYSVCEMPDVILASDVN